MINNPTNDTHTHPTNKPNDGLNSVVMFSKIFRLLCCFLTSIKSINLWQTLVIYAFIATSQATLADQLPIEFPEGCYFSSSKSPEEASKDPDAALFWLRLRKTGTVYRGQIANVLTREYIPDLHNHAEKISVAATIDSLVKGGYIDHSSNTSIESIASEKATTDQNQILVFIKFSNEIQTGPELRKIFNENRFKLLLVNYIGMPIPLYSIRCASEF